MPEQYLSRSEMIFLIGLVIIIVGTIAIWLSYRKKKPTVTLTERDCELEYYQLAAEIKQRLEIDNEAYEWLIKNFIEKYYGHVSEKILEDYSKKLYGLLLNHHGLGWTKVQ